MTTVRIGMIAFRLSVAMSALASGRARADEARPPGVGGHVGFAASLVTFTSDDTTTAADQFTLAAPIGIGFKLGDKTTIDFEAVVSNPISPRGTTGLTIDPGILRDVGSVILGLRLAWKVNADTNVGVIPLVHKSIASLGGGASWFVEAAVPSFVQFGPDPRNTGGDRTTFEIDVVLHTGVGF